METGAFTHAELVAVRSPNSGIELTRGSWSPTTRQLHLARNTSSTDPQIQNRSSASDPDSACGMLRWFLERGEFSESILVVKSPDCPCGAYRKGRRFRVIRSI